MSDDAVRIPIQLEVSGIDVSKANAKEIQKELTHSMSGLRRTMTELFKNVDTSGLSENLKKTFDSMKDSYQDVLKARDKYSGRLTDVSKDDSPKNLERASQAAKELDVAMAKLNKEYAQFTQQYNAESTLTAEYRSRLQVIRDLVTELKFYRAMANKADADGASPEMWQGILDRAKATDKVARDMLATVRELVKTGEAFELGASEDDIAEQKALMQSLNGTLSYLSQGTGAAGGRAGFQYSEDAVEAIHHTKELESELQALQLTIQNVNQLDVRSDKWVEWHDRIAEIEAELHPVAADVEEVAAASADIDGSGVIDLAGSMEELSANSSGTEKTIEELAQKVVELTARVAELEEELGKQNNSQPLEDVNKNARESDQRLKEMQQTLSSVRLGLTLMGTSGSSVLFQMITLTNLWAEAMKSTATATNSIIPIIGIVLGIGSRAIQTIISLVEKLINLLKNLAMRVVDIAKKISGTLLTGVKKLSASVSSLFSSLTSNKKDMADYKRMLMQYIFGFRSAYFLIRRLRQTIIDGMKDIAAQSEPVREVMSAFSTQLNEVKGKLVAAFQPVISYVLPILTRLLQVLSQVMTALAKFFAVLTGQDYYFDYTANMVDYADAIGGVGKAAKEAKKDLMGFDEINRLSAPNEPSGGGAGKEGEFTPSPIDTLDAVSKFAEMVKAAWKAGGDFTEVGNYVGQQFSDLLDFFNTDLLPKVDKFVTKLITAFATFINGFVEVEGLGTQVGTTIANMGNTLVGWIGTFLSTVHWDSVGKFIGDAINGAFLNFDWVSFFVTISDFFNDMFILIDSVAQTVEWWKIGRDIAFGFRMGLYEFDAAKFGQTVHDVVGGIFDLFMGFIQTMDLKDKDGKTGWQLLGEKISEFFENLDTKDLGYKMGFVVSGLITGLVEVIKSANFDEAVTAFAEGFSDGMGTHDWKGALMDLWNDYIFPKVKAFWGWLKPKLKALIKKALSFFMREILPELGRIALSALGGNSMGFGKYILQGFTTTIAELEVQKKQLFDTLGGIFQFILAQVTAFALNLAGKLPVIINTGRAIIGGLLSGIVTAMAGIQAWLDTNIYQPIYNGITGLFGIVGEKAATFQVIGQSFVDGLKEPLENLWEDVKEPFENMATKVAEWAVGIKSAVNEKMDELKTDIGGKWDAIKETTAIKTAEIHVKAVDKFNEIKTDIIAAFTFMRDVVQLVWDGLWLHIKSAINLILGGIEFFINRMVDALNAFVVTANVAIGKLNEIADLIPDNPFGFGNGHLPTLSSLGYVSIPRLAEGAVLPPNNPFLAMVGDQTHGTNVEAPLETIKQAVAEVMGENSEIMLAGFEAVVQAIQNKDMSVKIGDRDIGQANARYMNQRANMVGG